MSCPDNEPGCTPENRCRECDLEHALETWPTCEHCGERLWANGGLFFGFYTRHDDDCPDNDLRVGWTRLPRKLKKRARGERFFLRLIRDDRACRALRWWCEQQRAKPEDPTP